MNAVKKYSYRDFNENQNEILILDLKKKGKTKRTNRFSLNSTKITLNI